jgi:uncharacterized protein
MDMTSERLIPARREAVWLALNDTTVLKSCIPGCESLEMESPNVMHATATIRLGPITARFTGRVTLSELDPPNGYVISGEGKGGTAGFAKGSAVIGLSQRTDGTLLHYTVKAQVGGKLAQLGARLIDATAKTMADQFFTKFTATFPSLEATGGVDMPPTEPERRSSAWPGPVILALLGILALVASAFWFLPWR